MLPVDGTTGFFKGSGTIEILFSATGLIKLCIADRLTEGFGDEISCTFNSGGPLDNVFPEYPDSRGAARVCTRYVLAVTAIMGSEITYNIEATGAEVRKDPRVVDFFKRINVVGDPELNKVLPEKKPCLLVVKTRDGKQFSRRNDGPFKGDTEDPLSEEDIETKFYRLTKPVLGDERASQIISNLRQLEELDDVSKLVGLLTA